MNKVQITAKSKIFSCKIIIPEKKALSQLESIRDHFKNFRERNDDTYKDKLKVTTKILKDE